MCVCKGSGNGLIHENGFYGYETLFQSEFSLASFTILLQPLTECKCHYPNEENRFALMNNITQVNVACKRVQGRPRAAIFKIKASIMDSWSRHQRDQWTELILRQILIVHSCENMRDEFRFTPKAKKKPFYYVKRQIISLRGTQKNGGI